MVGPNGSGKSNVIDAMLFVFGKRAKQLRLNKVSELIHNSTHHRNLEMARVSVHFQEIVDLVRRRRRARQQRCFRHAVMLAVACCQGATFSATLNVRLCGMRLLLAMPHPPHLGSSDGCRTTRRTRWCQGRSL